MRVLFLSPQMQGSYWAEILKKWFLKQPQLHVLVGIWTHEENFLKFRRLRIFYPSGGSLAGRKMYYPEFSQRYPTPFFYLMFFLIKNRGAQVVCYGFSGWTFIASIFRASCLLSKLYILYEGSSPGVDLKNQRVRQVFRRFMSWCADSLVTQSHRSIEYLKTLTGKKKILVEPWLLVDPEAFVSKGDFSKKITRCVYIGSLEYRKGTDFLLELISGLGPQFEWSLIGPFDQSMGFFTFHAQVDFLGPKDSEWIKGHLSQYDVFLFPSREETWGMAPVEAAAAGLIVMCEENVPSASWRPHWIRLPLEKSAWREQLTEISEWSEEQKKMVSQKNREFEMKCWNESKPSFLFWDKGPPGN